MEARYKDRDWLHGKYTDEGWSTTDIGKFCGVSHKTICRWLDKHGIPTRDAQACQLTQSKRQRREVARQSVRDYLQRNQQPIQEVEGKQPTLKWS